MTSAAGKRPTGQSPAVAAAGPKLHPEILAARTRDVLAGLLILRLVNALSVRTFFQPDEYFQALEPAWNIAFGQDSGSWMTWEWQHQLRSSLHPALFAGVYVTAHNVSVLLRLPPPLRAFILTIVPKVAQALFAALGDFFTWKLAEQIYGQGSTASWAALWMTVLNPWQWYCSTRTFSNSLETTLTIMALYHWPWAALGDSKDKAVKMLRGGSSAQSLRLSLLLAATAVILRPTNLFIWIAILTLALTRMTLDGENPLDGPALVVLFSEIALCGTVVLGISLACDRFYFGFWTFPAYKWLHFNISRNLAVFYGRNDWHYYLSQGLPLLTTTALPFALAGLYRSTLSSPPPPSSSNSGRGLLESNTRRTLAFAALTTVGVLSLISHKEVRFIYPLLPILHVLAAPHAASFFTTTTTTTTTTTNATNPSSPPTRKLSRKPILALLAALNLLLAGYLSLFHQPAPLSVLTFLRHEYERVHPARLLAPAPRADLASPTASALAGGGADANPSSAASSLAGGGGGGSSDDDEFFALFLTPCHSTPWRSHLVYPGLIARALTCEPPLHTAPGSDERARYLDEADRFYADGPAFLAREMWPRAGGSDVPRFIVGFEGIEDTLRGFFDAEKGPGADLGVRLTRVWEGWNGLFNEDWRRRGLLVVWDTGIYPNGTVNT